MSTALYFLNSLKPRISEILNGDKGVKVPLEVMHVLKTEKMWINTKEKTREARGKEEVHDRIRNGTNENASRGGPEVHDDDIQEKEAIGAGVLYVAPEIKNQSMNMDLLKLIQVSSPSESLSISNLPLTDHSRLCPPGFQRRWLSY